MPTFGSRSGLVASALSSYLHQTYACKQLIVIDDSVEPLRDLFADVAGLGESELVYVHSPQRLTVGAKRNLACDLADGDIICHFDSDDLAAPDRVDDQVRTLIHCGKPITGFHTFPLYDTLTHESYMYHQHKTFVAGASLMYWKAHWERYPFPDVMVNEDIGFCIERPKDRHAVDGSRLILILLHDTNISTRRICTTHPTVFRRISTDAIPPQFIRSHQDVFQGYDVPVIN